MDSYRGGVTIDDWRPEDHEFWEDGGRQVARRNLIWSIFAEHLGFSVWLIWSVSVGVPAAQGGLHVHRRSSSSCWSRCRTWSARCCGCPTRSRCRSSAAATGRWSAPLLLLVPTLLFAFAVQHPETPYWVFCLIAATAGFGGGNFASSMANINFFYPAGQEGRRARPQRRRRQPRRRA